MAGIARGRGSLTIHGETLDRLQMHAEELQGFFTSFRFVLRDLPGHGTMELLVDSASPQPVSPRPVADFVLQVVRETVARAVPGLHFALAVPARVGGRWEQGAALHEAEAEAERELVLIDWLEERLKAAGTGSVAVGWRPALTRAEALAHYRLWLSQPAADTVRALFLRVCKAQCGWWRPVVTNPSSLPLVCKCGMC